MFKSIKDALIEQEWAAIDIEVYFFWNELKLENSGQVHIKSNKSIIGFKDGEKVNVFVDPKLDNVIIISTGIIRTPGEKAKETDNWRILTQGKLKNQDFDFKHRPLFRVLKIKSAVSFKGKKVRASDYIAGVKHDQFAIVASIR